MKNPLLQTKNRGAISNPEGRFETIKKTWEDDGWDHVEEEILSPLETLLFPDKTKSIITKNDSPDIGFDQSINPYKGCEHGCIYCYARPSHAYMNLSAGLDFETKIFYKADAAKLLEKEINKPNYTCKPFAIGSNTDPYQPQESKLKITRSILEVLNQHHHPATIITKNSLIERDIDIISDMAQRNLMRVCITVTTLSLELKKILEPRASSPQARLRTIKNLTQAGVPVSVITAPIIPMLNDMELEKILKKAAEVGAYSAGYTLIRLPYEVKDLFQEWLLTHFPERANHIMSLIKQMHDGKIYDASFGKRMTGEGLFAEMLNNRFILACKRLRLNQNRLKLDTKQFTKRKSTSAQLDLFDC